MKTLWIAVDWGTTNFRAFLLNDQQVIAQHSAPCGLLAVENGAFATTLQRHLSPWLNAYGALPILLAGMVGSQQGWQEIPYVPAPAEGQTLARSAQSIATPWHSPAWIIPGVSGISHFNQLDVMRGEEVQLLGLNALHPAAHHQVILPGTHSKHASLSHGEITQFSTFMTGELFSLLTQHSLLGRALPEQQESREAFQHGVISASHNAPFSHLIFSARTRRLNAEIAPQHLHSYLSGLLIGHELCALNAGSTAWVVGSSSLNERYQLAAHARQITLHSADGDACFLRGMAALRALLQENPL